MKITSVTIRRFDKENSRKKGSATVVLDDCFAIHDISIIERIDGSLVVSMPRKTTLSGEFKDIVHPINSETRQMFNEAVTEAYLNHKED